MKPSQEPPGVTTDPVAVVGYSLRAPNCSSVPEFARALKAGQDLTTSLTRYPNGHLGLPPRQGRIKDKDIASFDFGFFRLGRRQAEAMDPLIRMLLQVSYEALMDAKINIQSIRGSNTGVYVGHCFSDVSSHYTSSFKQEKTGYELVNGANSMAANRLSFYYDFKGPSLTIDTACSSSLVALHYAVQDVSSGIVERAVVAGLSLTMNPHKNASFNAFRMLSPTGHCHVFDERADGYCRSDGVASVILERGRKGCAIVAGTGTNSDGAKEEGITYPSSTQQARLFARVFAKSCITPEEVSYHEAHGTGTIAGDREELAALSKVYCHPMVIGSVKSNMGHAEGAAGLMGLIKILLMYEDRELYPNFGFHKSPHVSIERGQFTVLKRSMKWTPTACTVSSFGFGGSNALAILLPCISPKSLSRFGSDHFRPLPFASSKNAGIPSSIYDKFYAMQRVLGNHNQFKYVWKESEWREHSPLVFVFDGQGSQWNHMGRDLVETSNAFRSTMQRLESETGIPLVDLYKEGHKWMSKEYSTIGIVSFQLGLLAILREAGVYPDIYLGHSVGELSCSFLAGFASEAEVLGFAIVRTNLVKLLDKHIRLDVYENRPTEGYDYVIEPQGGHADVGLKSSEYSSSTSTSMGKDSETHWCDDSDEVGSLAASSLSELSLGTETETSSGCLFVKRNRVDDPLDSTVVESFSMKGQMVVVGCTAEEIDNATDELGLQQTRVACFNAPKGQTVSGPSSEVAHLVEYLEKRDSDVFIRELSTDNIAYHGMHLKVFRSWLRRSFGEINSIPLPASWRSTSHNHVFDTDYLIENICGPVFFQEAIESLPHGATVVEIGPASGMLAQIKRTRPDLSRIGLVERDSPATGTRLEQSLQQLLPWVALGNDDQQLISRLEDDRIHYNERYPSLWDQFMSFHVQTWDEFELPQATGAPRIIYDLTKKPWTSLHDHIIRGQNLFPASGFIHALWSVAASHEGNTEVLDLRIHTPLVIAPSANAVVMRLHKAGVSCELWDDAGAIRYVSGRVQPAASTTHPPSTPTMSTDLEYIDGTHFYPDRRRLGYEYGARYQNLDRIASHNAQLRQAPNDWISYIDTLLHLRLVDDTSCSYPVGFDRVLLWEQSLSKAPLWVERPQENTIWNSAVLLEGIRFEYWPLITSAPLMHREKFIEFGESEDSLDPKLVAAMLCRESRMFRVKQPLLSPSLLAIVEKLLESNIAEQDNESSAVVVSDSSETGDAELLITVDPAPPSGINCLVARWADVRVYRFGTSWTSLPVTTDWKHAVGLSKPFVWCGEGTSGAVTSLFAETGGQIRAISYEGSATSLVGLEKGMRLNYVREDGAHGMWVDVTGDSEDAELTSEYAMLEVIRPGQLDSLEWSALAPRNFTVRTSVATLNFRDVMRAMGRLKERDLSLGLEFSGIEISNGRRVFGIAKHALSTHCCPIYSFPTPPDFSDEEAATIPVVYLTVYYALFHKAKMKQGQSVLIHAGSGGIGMAAITLAQKHGLKILTTCSAPKRHYLKEKFGLSDEQIGDSRSDSFVGTVMAGTDGKGVDVVLNQLSGALQIASLRCLAPGGHFCEIGKYDILQNSALGQALLAANVSFHVIDLLPLLCDKGNKVLWDQWLKDGFAAKEIVPLPVTRFDASKVVDAFRFMSQGKHRGKIVISGLHKQAFFVRQLRPNLMDETHLITGGLGGLGLSIACRLAQEGCPSIVLVGRKGLTNGFQRKCVNQMQAWGCNIHVIKTDLLTLTRDSVPPPDKIWHAATVYRDMYLSDMIKESWDLVVQTKVQGYQHLRQCWPSAHIIAISSVVAYFGNAMQTSYALANASLDAAARQDPRTLSIRLGPLDNVGFITQGVKHRKLFEHTPFQIMRVDDVLDGLFQITTKHRSGVFGIYELKTTSQSITSKISAAPSADIYTVDDARKSIAAILGGSPEQYKSTTALKASGLDSLSTMEVVHHIQQESGSLKFKPSNITDQFTLQDMVSAINQKRSTSKIMDGCLSEEEQPEKLRQQATGEGAAGEVLNASREMTPVAEKQLSFSSSIGIVAIEMYIPTHAIASETLEHHGIRARTQYALGAVSVWDGQEDSVSMAMNAVSLLLEKHVGDPYSIGRLEVSTRCSGDVDLSIKSYLMELLPRDHFDVEAVHTADTSDGGTAALFNSLAWCRETGQYAIIVATDADEINVSESGWRGASAVALLVGPSPWIEIHGDRASCFSNKHCFLELHHSQQNSPHTGPETRIDHYIQSLDYTLERFRTEHMIEPATFDAFLFHGGLSVAFRKRVEQHLIEKVGQTTSWMANFECACRMAGQMGGPYTGSLYVNLVSLLLYARPQSIHCIGLFSYGFGSTATLFYATVHHERGHPLDLPQRLANRSQVSFETLRQVVASKGQNTVLERHSGIFYRGVLQDSMQPVYFKEGGRSGTAFATTSSPEKSSTIGATSRHLPSSTRSSVRGFCCQIGGQLDQHPTQRFWLGLVLAAATSYWIVSISISSGLAKRIFGYGAVVFSVCCLVHAGAHWTVKKQNFRVRGSATTLAHYLTGVLCFISYGILYAIDDITFLKNWGAVYFGFHLTDNFNIILFWEEIHPNFRFFYCLHHALGLSVTATWAIVDSIWPDYIILGVMLWLTAETWPYGLILYRHFPGTHLSADTVIRLNLVCFGLERAHRIAAYLSALVWASFDFSDFGWFVFASGLFLDMFDIWFQWRTIRSRHVHRRALQAAAETDIEMGL